MSERASSGTGKDWTEEIEVGGANLLHRIKELAAEGCVRRLRIKAADGTLILEIPLTIGAVAGGVITLAAPQLALVAAFASLVAHATIEITREGDAATSLHPPVP